MNRCSAVRLNGYFNETYSMDEHNEYYDTSGKRTTQIEARSQQSDYAIVCCCDDKDCDRAHSNYKYGHKIEL